MDDIIAIDEVELTKDQDVVLIEQELQGEVEASEHLDNGESGYN